MHSIRVVTLNCWGNGQDADKRWPLLVRELARLNPDVICLQEVFQKGRAQALQKTLGFSHWVDGSRYGGLVLASRYKKIASGFLKYKTKSPTENYFRYALWSRLQIGKAEWDFFVTHLSWKLPESEIRQHQMGELWDWICSKNNGQRPCVLAGDMNAVPQSDEIKFLSGEGWLYLSKDGMARVLSAEHPFVDTFTKARLRERLQFHTWARKNLYTRRAHLPDRRIDYIWFRPVNSERKFIIKKSQVCFTQPAEKKLFCSDHFGVMTEIGLKNIKGEKQ